MSIFARRPRRIIAGTLVGALALSVSPILGLTGVASAADPLPPLADPIGAGNFCEDAPSTEPFTDVLPSDPSFDEITCLVATGLTNGTTATTYSPNGNVTRRQMALFIKRTADLFKSLEVTAGDLTALPAYDGTPDFSDHAAENAAFEEAIGQLAQAGIVGGFPDGEFKPGALVSRRQMAAFINGLQDFLTGAPFADTGDFFDDDSGDSGEANLDALAGVGIFQGDGAGNVFPGNDLTRRQMANILLRYAQVLFDAGTIEGPFEPLPPATNADLFSDASEGAQVATFDPDGTGVQLRTYTFSGLDDTKEYDVVLFPVNDGGGYDGGGYEDGVSQESGIWMFRDQETPFDGLADSDCFTSDDESFIQSINGDDVSESDCEYDVTPEGGELEIQLSNDDDESDSAFLVIWTEPTANNDELNLDGEDQPSEPFGVVGPVVWTEGECSLNEDAYGDVLYVDKVANSMVLDEEDCTAFYDDADSYFYDDGPDYGITGAEFESWVNNGDWVETEDLSTDNTYSPTAPNDFNLYDDYAATPDDVTATASNNDVTVTWTHDPTLANMGEDADEDAEYCITRWNATTDASDGVDCFGFDDDEAFSDAVMANRTVVLDDVVPGTYYYTVYACSASDDCADYSDPSADVTSTGSAVVGPPCSVSAVHTDGNVDGIVSNGDQLVAVFSESMAAPDAGDSVTLMDAQGTIGTLINGTNATFVKFSDNTLVFIVGPAGPLISTEAGNPGLEYIEDPAAIVSSGNTDLNEGLEWDFGCSTDESF